MHGAKDDRSRMEQINVEAEGVLGQYTRRQRAKRFNNCARGIFCLRAMTGTRKAHTITDETAPYPSIVIGPCRRTA